MDSWGASFRAWIELLVKFAVRRRSPGGLLLKGGLAVFVAALGGWKFAATYGDGTTGASVLFATGEGTPAMLTYLGFLVGAALIVVGTALLIRDANAALAEKRAEAEAKQRRQIVVVEQRGLLARIDSPLVDAVPESLVGRRDTLPLDHTAALRNGVADRGILFDDARNLRRDIRQRLGDVAPTDVTIVYGGVAPVPMTFLAGAVLDDEGAVTVMDWDRVPAKWRRLDGQDDGDRFTVPDLGKVQEGTAEVFLAVSASYLVDEDAIRALAEDAPVIRLAASKPVPNSHWSEAKQAAMAEQFLSIMGRLTSLGVARVHLFLAGANSFVFNLGRTYDGRNMPELVVYQYEKSSLVRYPWGIRLPRHGEPEPGLVINDHGLT
ncbi:SAVED domain-containing protein [Roseomonas sp. 18066]|uniref:SAVED domain-containing protein n=1 Tax=Roseomonas sp. 18066 TaxID=2681412 RepID=UPI001359A069|nr:SAVED domain-containing protein [Roseomonas sp. 18066]